MIIFVIMIFIKEILDRGVICINHLSQKGIINMDIKSITTCHLL
jgi:hypothetical protein